jgi:predicted TPR repeat methyltransferase
VNDLAIAIENLRQDRLDAAETTLQRLIEPGPDQTDALHFMGLLRHAQGRPGEAIGLIRESLARQPANTSAWNNLGNVCLLAGRTDDAADAYAHAVEHADALDADSALALANLGALYRKLGRLDDSERACRRAVEIAPGCGDAWYQLSATLIRAGRVHDGLLAHSRAVALWPELLQSRGEIVRALLVLGERERASRLLHEWLDSDPGNAVAEHLLAACQAADGAPAPQRASDAYVRQVFDSFAASFDAKLEALHYRAPELVAAALRSALPAPAAQFDIADLGCGTGLCGPLLRPWTRRLAGCDLSVGMLRRAKARGGYDALHQAELVYYLATQPAAFDVVVSADTLCYFGDLHDALAAAARALRPGGWLVFTVEALATGAVRLHPTGRYAHGEQHVRDAAAAAALHVHSLTIDTLRDEAGQHVRGWLAVLHKKA